MLVFILHVCSTSSSTSSLYRLLQISASWPNASAWGRAVRRYMSNFSTVVAIEGALALVSPLLAHCVSLSRSVNVHVDDLVVHFLRGVGGIVTRSGLEVKTIEEIASE